MAGLLPPSFPTIEEWQSVTENIKISSGQKLRQFVYSYSHISEGLISSKHALFYRYELLK